MLKRILIVGASSGIGSALAIEYAAPGIDLILAARRRPLLEATAARARERGADVSIFVADIGDEAQIGKMIAGATERAPIDLLIVSAGIYLARPEGVDLEPIGDLLAQIETNLMGNIRVISALLPAMMRQRRGRIAIISSLAALQPLPDALGYTASKAGLAAYGEALRELLADHGIAVSVVYPGHVDTKQISGHVGSLPMMIPASDAARRIRKGLDRGRATIAFPRTLMLLIALGRVVPWWARAWFNRPLRFHVKRGQGGEPGADAPATRASD